MAVDLDLLLRFIYFFLLINISIMAADDNNGLLLSLESVRNSLIRQEDTIIFALIERSKFPVTSVLYDDKSSSSSFIHGVSGSLFQYFVKQTESIQAKVTKKQKVFCSLSFVWIWFYIIGRLSFHVLKKLLIKSFEFDLLCTKFCVVFLVKTNWQ